MEKSKKIIRFTGLFLLFGFCLALILRIVYAEYYPKSIKRLYYTDALTEYYEAHGEIDAKTQKIHYYYNEGKYRGDFFADNLIVIPDAEHIQFTVRYNESTIDDINEFYSQNIEEGREGLFTYKLFASNGEDDNGVMIGEEYSASAVKYKGNLLYNYEKVAFDCVNFTDVLRMEVRIYLSGSDEEFGAIIVYENNESYNTFEDYKLKRSEKP